VVAARCAANAGRALLEWNETTVREEATLVAGVTKPADGAFTGWWQTSVWEFSKPEWVLLVVEQQECAAG
jgi:hypothetical protein